MLAFNNPFLINLHGPQYRPIARSSAADQIDTILKTILNQQFPLNVMQDPLHHRLHPQHETIRRVLEKPFAVK
jgi:hypothetical protein